MNRTYWIVVGALLAGLALMTFLGLRLLVLPLKAEYADAIAQKQEIQAQLDTARATAKQFGKFKAQAEVMRRNLDFYKSRTDGVVTPVGLTELLDSLGNEFELDQMYVQVASQAAGRAAAVGQFQVHVTFLADFARLGAFLNACVTQQRIIVPASVSLRSNSDATGLYTDTMAVDLQLIAYGGAPAKPRPGSY